jgi:hypothetical protein
MQTKIIGYVLMIAGLLLLIVEAKWAEPKSLVSWPFLLFLFGITLIFISFLNKQPQLTLLGGVLASIGITVWGFEYVSNWPKHWSILVGMLGITVMLQYILNQSKTTLIVGCVLLLSGFFAWPGIREISLLAPIANFLNTYWPVLIVVLGAVFLFRK